jgi:hypothetical protein
MAKFKDYSDQRFGRLVAMSFVGRKASQRRLAV